MQATKVRNALELSLSFQRSLPVMGYSPMMHCSQSPLDHGAALTPAGEVLRQKTASFSSLLLPLPKGQVHSVIQGTVGRLSS